MDAGWSGGWKRMRRVFLPDPSGLKAAKNDAVSKQAGHELAFAHAPRLLYRNRFQILHV
jgi:hypothetical protein